MRPSEKWFSDGLRLGGLLSAVGIFDFGVEADFFDFGFLGNVDGLDNGAVINVFGGIHSQDYIRVFW